MTINKIIREGLLVMKKLLSVALALALVLALGTVSAFAAVGDKYDAFEQFDKVNNDASNVPWKYMITKDKGATFTELTLFEVRNYGKDYNGWFQASDNYCGLGINLDAPEGTLELNIDKNQEIAVLAFVAPNDGSFKLSGKVLNPFNQDAQSFMIKKGSNEVLNANITALKAEGDMTEYAFVKTVDLKEGDVVYFFGTTSNEESGWFSMIVDIEVEEVEPATEEPPQTGDSSVVMFVVLGLAALAGIVVFSRKLRIQ